MGYISKGEYVRLQKKVWQLNLEKRQIIKAKEFAVQTRINENKELKRQLAARESEIAQLKAKLHKIRLETLRV